MIPRIATGFAAMLIGAGAAAADDTPKWAPHVDLEAMPGTSRSIGTLDLFAPLLQNDSALLFADVRGRADDLQNREGNFGLGFRQMMPGGWNVGSYVYFDRLHSETGNGFSQVTVGSELLGLDWDFRINGYIPASGTKPDSVPDEGAVLVGSSIELVSGAERSLGGGDIEAGWRVPVWDVEAPQQVRLYAGAYYFAAAGVPTVTGPRGRVELTLYDAAKAWPGLRITAGGEVQHDGPRGTQASAMLRLRVPFGAAAETARTLDAQERRMIDAVVRDVDIVTGVKTLTEPAISVDTGAALQNVTTVNTSAGQAAVQAALNGPARLVMLNGSGGPLAVSSASGLTVGPNQILAGGGASITVVGAETGKVATFNVPGTEPTLQGTFGGSIITASTGSTVRSMIFAGANAANIGILVPNGATGVVIADNQFGGLRLYGVLVNGATQPTTATIDHNMFTLNEPEATGIGAGGLNTSTTITNNMFTATGAENDGLFLGGASAFVANNVFIGTYATADEFGGVFSESAAHLGGAGNDLTGVTAGTPCSGSQPGTITGSIGFTGPGGVAGSVPNSCVPFPTDGGGGGGVVDTFFIITPGTIVDTITLPPS